MMNSKTQRRIGTKKGCHPPSSSKTKALSREKKAEANRQALLEAAAKIIGEHGYIKASIARITQRAGLAQGTFYLYFESRQALFDILLPEMGERMLKCVAAKVTGAQDILEVERRGFRAFFEYLADEPAFFRVLNEAETHAPKGYAKHFSLLCQRYMASLQRSRANGELPDFATEELEVIVYILMAARSYLYLRYSKQEGSPNPIPDWVVETFMKFISGGFLQGRRSITCCDD